jgi:hypothetical protein
MGIALWKTCVHAFEEGEGAGELQVIAPDLGEAPADFDLREDVVAPSEDDLPAKQHERLGRRAGSRLGFPGATGKYVEFAMLAGE